MALFIVHGNEITRSTGARERGAPTGTLPLPLAFGMQSLAARISALVSGECRPTREERRRARRLALEMDQFVFGAVGVMLPARESSRDHGAPVLGTDATYLDREVTCQLGDPMYTFDVLEGIQPVTISGCHVALDIPDGADILVDFGDVQVSDGLFLVEHRERGDVWHDVHRLRQVPGGLRMQVDGEWFAVSGALARTMHVLGRVVEGVSQ